jgi:hypothetical protein
LDLSYRAVKALALVGPRSVFGLGWMTNYSVWL